VNDRPVRKLSDLTDLLEQAGVGKTVALNVQRDNRSRTINVAIVDVGQGASPARRP
jgi:2-alkenal reductase